MMMRQRVSGDYLQTSAWIDRDGTVYSAVNDPNDYQGPGTGYKISEERWQEIKEIPWRLDLRMCEEGKAMQVNEELIKKVIAEVLPGSFRRASEDAFPKRDATSAKGREDDFS